MCLSGLGTRIMCPSGLLCKCRMSRNEDNLSKWTCLGTRIMCLSGLLSQCRMSRNEDNVSE